MDNFDERSSDSGSETTAASTPANNPTATNPNPTNRLAPSNASTSLPPNALDPQEIFRNAVAGSNPGVIAAHITQAVTNWRRGSGHAYNAAIELLRHYNPAVLSREIVNWLRDKNISLKDLLWVLAPLLGTALLGALLPVIGFTAVGPAAGMYDWSVFEE